MPITDLPNQLPNVEPIENAIDRRRGSSESQSESQPLKKPFPRRLIFASVARPTAPTLRRTAPRIPPNIPAHLAGANSPIPLVYGEARVVCEPVVMPRQSGRYWICLYKVCKGEIDSLRKVTIDGRTSDVSAKTAATEFDDVTLVGSTGKVIFYVGTAGQNVSTWMSTYISAYPDSLPNQAMIAFKILDAYFTGLPRVECIVRGFKSITDDRTSPVTTGYSNNAALCLAHFIETYHGRTVNVASKNTAADACDEAVGSGVRRTLNLALYTPQSTSTIIRTLAAHAGCFLFDAGTEIKLIADRPATKVFDIGEALVMGETKCRKKKRNAKPGDVKILWYDVENNAQKPAFAIGSGPVNNLSIVDMPGITNYEQAKREAIERYNHLNLEDLTIDCIVRDEALQLEVGDVVAFSDHTVGQGDKLARVMGMALAEPGRWALQLLEYQENAYSDSIETDPVTLDTDLPDPFTVPTITGLTVAIKRYLNNDGTELYRLEISWTDPAWDWTDLIHVLVEDITGTLDSPETSTWVVYSKTVPSDRTSVGVAGLAGYSRLYKTTVRIKSLVGVYGSGVSANQGLLKLGAAPGAVSSVGIGWQDAAKTIIALDWTAPSNLDVEYYILTKAEFDENGGSPPAVTTTETYTANSIYYRTTKTTAITLVPEAVTLTTGDHVRCGIIAVNRSGDQSAEVMSGWLTK